MLYTITCMEMFLYCVNDTDKLYCFQAAAVKSCAALAPWVKDIQNHFWYCAKNCEGSVEKFTVSYYYWYAFIVIIHIR